MTTLSEAKIAITDRFIAEWEGKTIYTTENEGFTEPEKDTWVRLTVRNIGGGGVSMGRVGNRRYDRKGIIVVSIYTSVEQGTSEADLLAQDALVLFEGTRFNGVTVNDGVINEVGADDTWYQINMKAEFEYYEIK